MKLALVEAVVRFGANIKPQARPVIRLGHGYSVFLAKGPRMKARPEEDVPIRLEGTPPDERSRLQNCILELVDAYRIALAECDDIPAFSAWGYLSLLARYVAWFLCLGFVPIVLFANLPAYIANRFFKRSWRYRLMRVVNFFCSVFVDFYRVDLSGLRVMRIRYVTRLFLAAHINSEFDRLRARLLLVTPTISTGEKGTDSEALSAYLDGFAKMTWPKSGFEVLITFPPLAAFLSVLSEWMYSAAKDTILRVLTASSNSQHRASSLAPDSPLTLSFAIPSAIQFVLMLSTVVALAIFSCLCDYRNIISSTSISRARKKIRDFFGVSSGIETSWDILFLCIAIALLATQSRPDFQIDPATANMWAKFLGTREINIFVMAAIQQLQGAIAIALFLLYLRKLAGWTKRVSLLTSAWRAFIRPQIALRFASLERQIGFDGLTFYSIVAILSAAYLATGAMLSDADKHERPVTPVHAALTFGLLASRSGNALDLHPSSFIIFFDPRSTSLNSEGLTVVRSIVVSYRSGHFSKVTVVGHNDASEDGDPNLSYARALAVGVDLEARGIPKTILEVSGLRFSQPLIPTGKGVSAPQNRRVVIQLIR